MELQFKSRQLDCLSNVLQEVCSSEQTQELKVGDPMPDVARVISAWGQPIMRGKEWHSNEITCSGGMLVWVLYAAESDQQPQVLNTWIPFQLRWNLPEGIPDGHIRISCLPRFVDARSISPRKIMIRCAMAAMGEAYIPDRVTYFAPEEETEDAQLLRRSYPLKLLKMAGEKSFLLDEELLVPESVPKPEAVVYCAMEPKLQDCRVLSDKLVFRGNGRLHMLYKSDGGQLHSWDFEIPFSQLTELGNTFGTDAQGDIRLAVTGLEPQLQEDGRLRLKCGLTAQYLILDKETVELAEDAYSLNKEMDMSRTELSVPVVLENTKQNLYGEQTLQANANLAADVRFVPEFPTQRKTENGIALAYPGNFQVLYYGEDGQLHGSSARWEGQETLPGDTDIQLTANPLTLNAAAETGNGSIGLNTELQVERMAYTEQKIPMVTDIALGQEKKPDPNRPSLILRRAGEESLWDIARENGSTVSAIRRINQLEGEPQPGQMLLIPVQ